MSNVMHLSCFVMQPNLDELTKNEGGTLAVPSCTLSQQLAFALGFVSLAS